MRIPLTSQKLTVVVDLSRGTIKLAGAETAGEAVRFHGVTRIPVDSSEAVEPDIRDGRIAQAIADRVHERGWEGYPAACLLSGTETSTQSFLFPPMGGDELRSAISLKLAQRLHFDVGEAYFDFRRVGRDQKNPEQDLVLVVAARKQATHRALAILRRAGLKPVAVGAASESLANLTYYASLCGEEEASVHIDIGGDSTILNLFEGRLLRFSREVDVAGKSFTEALMRPIITPGGPVTLDAGQAEEVKLAAGYPSEDQRVALPHGVDSTQILPLLEPVAQRLTAEIRRSMDYLRSILKRREVDRIVLSGSGARMRGLAEVLEENLETRVELIDPVARATDHWRLAICGEQPSSTSGFSATLGFSLGNHRPINLLPPEERLREVLARTATLRKVLVPSMASLALCLSLLAIPIDRTYGTAEEMMRATVGTIEGTLQSQEALHAEREATRAQASDVLQARGPVPDWEGLFLDLASLLPPEVQLTSLSSERHERAVTVRITAIVHPGPTPFDTTLAHTTQALVSSPFFSSVEVLDASAPGELAKGSFDASLDLDAFPMEPGP